MARTESTMSLKVGDVAPDFSLIDVVSGAAVKLRDGQSHTGTLVMFICNHCPFVIHVQDEFLRLARDYEPKGLRIIAINSNDVALYPQDGPEPMRSLALELGWTFPYCFDADQSVARAFRAACTPDFFLLDADSRLFYRGQLDASRPGNDKPVTGSDLRGAVEGLLTNNAAPMTQLPSLGCNIKWMKGNEPDYFG